MDSRSTAAKARTPERLDGFPGADASAANAINEIGSVAGASNTATAVRAFRWTRGGGFDDLGTLPGDTSSEAWGINRHNEVVGHSSGPGGVAGGPLGANRSRSRSRPASRRRPQPRLCASTTAVMSSEPPARAASFEPFSGHASVEWRISAPSLAPLRAPRPPSTTLAGSWATPSGAREELRFLWSRNDGMVDLGTLPGGSLQPCARHQRAGRRGGQVGQPFWNSRRLWTRQGELQDLNTLISASSDFVLIEAVSIDNQGVILATGHERRRRGQDHGHEHAATKLQPVSFF